MKSLTMLVCAAAIALPGFACAGESPQKIATRLSDDQLQDLQTIVSFASDPDSTAPASQMFSYAQTLALQQYRALPAYRDLYRAALDRLIGRLASVQDTDDRERLGRIAAAYEMLYRDPRWSDVAAADAGTSHPDDGLQPLFDAPWGLREFYHPLVAHMDFPNVIVRQADWDEANQTLRFALEPRSSETIETTFHITDIPTNFVSTLEQEGRQIAAIDEHGQAAGDRVLSLGPGDIQVTTTLQGLTHFEIRPL